MPVHDWICEPCDVLVPDQYHPSIAFVLTCPSCSQPCEKSFARRPTGRNGLFVPFTADIGAEPVEVRSLGDVRRIERDSERAYRDGKGAPVVFRAFSNDASNYDVNTLKDVGYQQIQPGDPRRARSRHDRHGRR